ncbi:hypothetical protein M3Y99_01954500 [Aphelenchoides fujianensis]|nr:hypothetical protein M3Y99_01954500 [Aphelenchoides fujianensis]
MAERTLVIVLLVTFLLLEVESKSSGGSRGSSSARSSSSASSGHGSSSGASTSHGSTGSSGGSHGFSGMQAVGTTIGVVGTFVWVLETLYSFFAWFVFFAIFSCVFCLAWQQQKTERMKVELELLNAKNGVQTKRTDDDVERQPLTGVAVYDSMSLGSGGTTGSPDCASAGGCDDGGGGCDADD